jgi:hypothetical protein
MIPWKNHEFIKLLRVFPIGFWFDSKSGIVKVQISRDMLMYRGLYSFQTRNRVLALQSNNP